ncbi:protein inturned-like [Oppia nitens]|uniref:protein inturned-like n=1 Tax=Oppia nitens TaxID=1686743 RepID=UPI0023DB5B09|nr:protein inturned-like [Oppia nitens]
MQCMIDCEDNSSLVSSKAIAMSSLSESSLCSTCTSSSCDSSHSSMTLNDEDMDYTNLLSDNCKPFLFYLKLLTNEETDKDKDNHTFKASDEHKDDVIKDVKQVNDRNTGLTSWLFGNKSFKRKSFKRKSSQKKILKEVIDNNNDNNNPSINVTVCDDINVNEVKTTNKLLDLIEGKCETFVSKIDNKLILLYLMPPNDIQSDCLLYSYPKVIENEDINPVLMNLKGMFVTLSQVVSQITNQCIKLSSITVNHENRKQIYKTGFIHEKDSLLVLALPNTFTDIQVEGMVETIARVLRFVYKSMDSAFNDQSKHENLTKLFSIVEYLLYEDSKNLTIDSLFINSMKRLIIDDELATNLSDSLSEFEAMDWISDNSTFDLSSQNSCQFIVIGSCLIYKGLLLSSHLPNHHLKDVYFYLTVNGFLSLHKSHSIRLIIWSEIFPNSEIINVFEDQNVKYIILIVGFQHLIHCTLIESPLVHSNETQITVNELIINESIRLLKWHFSRIGVIDEIDDCFNIQTMAAKQIFSSNKEQKRYKSLSSLKDLLFLSPASSQSRSQIYHSSSSLASLEGSSLSASIKSTSSPSLQYSMLSRSHSSSTTSLSQNTSKDQIKYNKTYLQQNIKLPENLICYLNIEDGQEVFAGPLLQLPKNICEKIFKKFTECCYEMSQCFRHSSSHQMCHEIGRTFQLKISSNFLSPNKLKSKKSDNEIYLFNVIGRQQTNVEFYACFKTNTNESQFTDFDIEDFIYGLHLQRRIL